MKLGEKGGFTKNGTIPLLKDVASRLYDVQLYTYAFNLTRKIKKYKNR